MIRLKTSALTGCVMMLLLGSTGAQAQSGEASPSLMAIESKIQALQSALDSLKVQLKQHKKVEHSPENVSQAPKDQPAGYTSGAVISSPTVGLESQYDGQDLLVSYSSMREDLSILQHRQSMDLGVDTQSRPRLIFSGGIEGQALWTTGTPHSDLDLTRFELDVLAEVSPWVSAMGVLAYDKGLSTGDVDRTLSGDLSLKRGFVTLGQLTQSPWYVSLGQMNMPFGRYSSMMLATSATSALGKITGRGAVIGYAHLDAHKDGWMGQLFVMQGKTTPKGVDQSIDQLGGSLAQTHHWADNQYVQWGAGLVRNLADANTVLGGLTATHKDQLKHRVPGVDGYVIVGSAPWRFGFEYVKALRALEDQSTSYGRYSGLEASVDYALDVNGIPSNVYLAYGRSTHASNFGLARSHWSVGGYLHLYKNTLQIIEYQHNTRYSGETSPDRHRVIFQLGAYF